VVISTHEHARQLVEQAVAKDADAWATTIRITATPQFKEDVTEALHACLRAHLRPPRQRRGDVHKKLDRVVKLATVTAPKLLELQDLLNELRPFFGHDPSFRLPPLYAIAFNLSNQARAEMDQRITSRSYQHQRQKLLRRTRSLAAAAKHYAEAFKDEGGVPKRLVAFDALVNGEKDLANGLTDAYERATKRAAKVTWHNYRQQYESRFLTLIEAVLPVACDIAEKATGHALPFPKTAQTRGAYVYEATRVGAGRPTKRKPAKRTREP
jgi:hypothetical protein